MEHKGFIVPIVDTDSCTVCKPGFAEFTKEEIQALTNELNSLMDEKINWEFEFYIPKILAIKSKNYVMDYGDGKGLKFKGSAIKSSTKEKVLKNFATEIIDLLVNEKGTIEAKEIYLKYVKNCFNLSDIVPWCKKVTLTDKIFRCRGHEKMTKEEKKEKKIRANEYKVLDALKGRLYQEGDKVYVFYNKDGTLSLLEDFDGKNYDEFKLVGKIHSSLKTFSALLDLNQFTKYHLKTKRNELLNQLTNVPL